MFPISPVLEVDSLPAKPLEKTNWGLRWVNHFFVVLREIFKLGIIDNIILIVIVIYQMMKQSQKGKVKQMNW